MNWLDEGAMYSQIAMWLREDLGRGDITSQAIVARNTQARGRFIAREHMVVAGLEAAEEVFLLLDSQQQLEAFASDGERVESGKAIARVTGFADVLLAGVQVALNLMQHLSAVATYTNELVNVVQGTSARIVDSRESTPGLRMLEKYAVLLGGGLNGRSGLDDGVLIASNHIAVCDGIAHAVKSAKEKLGHLHKIQVQVSNARDLRTAFDSGADRLLFEHLPVQEVSQLVVLAKELDANLLTEYAGNITIDNVKSFADAGIDLIDVNLAMIRALGIEFRLTPA